MKVLIVEDEQLSAERLSQLIRNIEPGVEILAQIDSVKRTVEWLRSQPAPDLLFLDIQLADGLSFEIFEKVDVKIPIIFTTAYDEYAIKAFKVNSVDYLLKPIDEDELTAALQKFKSLNASNTSTPRLPLDQLQSLISGLARSYKERFYPEYNGISYFESKRCLQRAFTIYYYCRPIKNGALLLVLRKVQI